MGSAARNYSPTTKRRLDTLSGNQCASPTCDKPLIAKDGESIISKICHIEAVSVDGPRYNGNMTDDERRDYKNLILLCDECHTIIDNKKNEQTYPKELLWAWKSEHEAKIFNTILTKKPSLLKDVINALSRQTFVGKEQKEQNLEAFAIPDKIKYNEVKRRKGLIEEYRVYYNKINSLYDELERQGSFKKEKLLENIKLIYVNVKGKYVEDSDNAIVKIRENADNIFDDVYEELSRILEKENGVYDEDISIGVSLIMVDAFMRCKILEEIPKNDNK
jgi:hypothetical protein